jgi:hypothetical protein
MEYARLAFWALLALFMIPLVGVAWIVLFWVRPEEEEDDESDDFNWEEDTTTEYVL